MGIKNFIPFIELLQENYLLFVTSTMALQKVLKSFTVRMKIEGEAELFCYSDSTYILFRL